MSPVALVWTRSQLDVSYKMMITLIGLTWILPGLFFLYYDYWCLVLGLRSRKPRATATIHRGDTAFVSTTRLSELYVETMSYVSTAISRGEIEISVLS
jgi:hypothetical protein